MSIVEKAVWYIEMKRAQPLQLSDIASACTVSPFHLSRVFRARTGMTVMAYVRARRLTEAARALTFGESDILSVALDAQFGSHEAFTRAFSGHFGHLPKAVREHRSLTCLNLTEPIVMDRTLFVDVDPPHIEDRDSFRVSGLAERYSFETNHGIPGLWQKFNERLGQVSSCSGQAAYGVCYNEDAEGSFNYMAGVEATLLPDTPAGFETLTIPGGRYAVFTHGGHISDLRKTVYTIWNKTLAEAELETRKAPDFELYDERFDPTTGRGAVEVWVPIN